MRRSCRTSEGLDCCKPSSLESRRRCKRHRRTPGRCTPRRLPTDRSPSRLVRRSPTSTASRLEYTRPCRRCRRMRTPRTWTERPTARSPSTFRHRSPNRGLRLEHIFRCRRRRRTPGWCRLFRLARSPSRRSSVARDRCIVSPQGSSFLSRLLRYTRWGTLPVSPRCPCRRRLAALLRCTSSLRESRRRYTHR
jgi:hypothetical protein